jgi:hypothetical protein
MFTVPGLADSTTKTITETKSVQYWWARERAFG